MPANLTAGILNINKPAGLTSHDVVQRVRRILGIKKVGHTGTLDPLATGVLVVCFGRATRLIEYIVPGQKQYRATLKLGESTDTFDSDGEIIATVDASGITESALRATLTTFLGEIEQIPPKYSAIKKNGVPLYKLAREGKEVVPPTRKIQINKIELLKFLPPLAKIHVICSAGTYIRSLAHDVGDRLGVGAHLTELVRVANGPWQLADAITLEDLTQAVNAGKLNSVCKPLESAVSHLPHIILSPEQKKAVVTGQRIAGQMDFLSGPIAAMDAAGQLVAILVPTDENQLKPKKVFQP